MPIFNGKDPCGWLLKGEKYFFANGVLEIEKIPSATVSMEEATLGWLQWREMRFFPHRLG